MPAIPRQAKLPADLVASVEKARPGVAGEQQLLPKAPESVAGFSVKVSKLPIWGTFFVAIIAAVFAGWAKLDVTPVPARVEAVQVNQGAESDRVDELEDWREAQREYQRALDVALTCRLNLLASVAERQGHDTGFGGDVEVRWRSEYLGTPRKVRTAPQWSAVKQCPNWPTPPGTDARR